MQAAQGAGWQNRTQRRRKKCFKEAELVATGKNAQAAQGLVANAALGRGDCAQESRIVIVVSPQAKPGTEIANFSAVKKTLAARYFVGNIGFAQCFFKGLGLVVGPVEHRKITQLFELCSGLRQGSFCPQTLDAGADALGLVLLAVCIDHAHRLTFAQVTP